MPQGDRTGPRGEGPKTGRQLGECEGAVAQGGFGRGFGRRFCPRGRGLGKGFVFANQVSLSESEERKVLEAEKIEIEKRLKELEE